MDAKQMLGATKDRRKDVNELENKVEADEYPSDNKLRFVTWDGSSLVQMCSPLECQSDII